MLSTPDGDCVYARLVEARDRCDDAGGEAFLARLVLLLADAIGDPTVVLAAVAEAEAARPRPIGALP